MTDLALLMDAFVEQAGRSRADFHFDETNASVAQRYERMIERTRTIGDLTAVKRIRDLVNKETQTRSFNIRTTLTSHPDLLLRTAHVGEIKVVGKGTLVICPHGVVRV